MSRTIKPLAEVKTVQVGAPPHGQVIDVGMLDQVWVLNSGGNSISRLDGTNGEIIGTVRLDGSPLRAKLDKEAGVAYVLLDDARVVVLDVRTDGVRQTLELPSGSRPTCLVPLSWRRQLCVTTYDGGAHVLDTTTNTWIADVPTGSGSVWGTPQVGPYGKLHIVNELSNDVTVVDEETMEVLTTLPAGRRPVRNITYPQHNAVYVANYDDGTVSVIDAELDKVVTTIQVGVHPGRMAVAQKKTGQHAVWVLNRGSDEHPEGLISVVSGAEPAVVRTIEVCDRPFQWKFEEPFVYVVSGTGGEITVVDERAREVVASIPLCRAPDLAADNVLKGGRRGIYLVNSDDTLTIYGPAD
jgi:YVTN family beta-propeller protein